MLGQSHLRVRFINTAPGAPLPDLLQLLFFPEPGQETLSISFVANANDDEACLHTTQIGLFMAGFNGAVADGFPAESIEITDGPCED